MAALQIDTYYNHTQIKSLLDYGEKILQQPHNVEQENHSENLPRVTKTLNNLLRAGHQIHFVEYQGKEYVFKVFADLGEYSPERHSYGRRVAFFLDNWIKNPARRSYQGAYTLKELNIPAIQPLAALSGRWGIHRRGLFIYESVQAEYNLKKWLKFGLSEHKIQAALEQLCKITRQLEICKYHFSDFKMDNILVEIKNTNNFTLTLIDTDEVINSVLKKYALLPKKWNLWLNLWHLRRLKPVAPLDEEFLRCHLGENYHPDHLETWRRFRRFQPNPIKWLKRKKKK
ncbi:MAG: hypothetical protein IBX50_19560 [Marinospirillum sp.]|uniref:lipopolysaccharide kinase InaA family protein n=1 Tax=Marinospirillum sp. TaxID=2183934 RepID=UPI0019E9FBAA|nr:lipopolysaccharide kinase InaA family protein [Marinospirillum sp.]MBE0508888.1 hypothetical protein [Marinospirillum sp.]